MTRGAAIAMLLLGVVTSCGRQADDTVLVMAAASLTESFQAIEDAFEAEHPEVEIQLNFAGSASLREQILQGAPADVFASANADVMLQVTNAGLTGMVYPFASNEIAIAVPVGNPAEVTSIGDLEDPDLLVGLCAQGVPCGDAARRALERANVQPSADTNERDVRSLVTKIAAGELDVGIVYRTDVAANDAVEAVDLAIGNDMLIVYPIAQLVEGQNPQQASEFVAFVRSSSGQQILADHGFGPP